MQYRRADTKGTSYFFTVNLVNRKSTSLVDNIDLLRKSIQIVKQRYSFKIDAIVVILDNLHAIFSLQEEGSDYLKGLMLIKSVFSREIPTCEHVHLNRASNHERGIW